MLWLVFQLFLVFRLMIVLAQVRLILHCRDMRLGLIRLVVGGLLLIGCETTRWSILNLLYCKGAGSGLGLCRIYSLAWGFPLGCSQLITFKMFILFAALTQTLCINSSLLRICSFPPLASTCWWDSALEDFDHTSWLCEQVLTDSIKELFWDRYWVAIFVTPVRSAPFLPRISFVLSLFQCTLIYSASFGRLRLSCALLVNTPQWMAILWICCWTNMLISLEFVSIIKIWLCIISISIWVAGSKLCFFPTKITGWWSIRNRDLSSLLQGVPLWKSTSWIIRVIVMLLCPFIQILIILLPWMPRCTWSTVVVNIEILMDVQADIYPWRAWRITPCFISLIQEICIWLCVIVGWVSLA